MQRQATDSWQILVIIIAQVKSVFFLVKWKIIYTFQEFFKDKVDRVYNPIYVQKL